MHAQALEISWHDSSSVWAVDASQYAGVTRLVTAGGDKTARVWRLCSRPSPANSNTTPQIDVKWVCDLRAHTSTVNVARFAPGGRLIATAADGGEIALWARERDAPKPVEAGTTTSGNVGTTTIERTGPAFGNAGGSQEVERWACVRTLRGHVHDVLDLSWSSCGGMLASASVDNSVMVWHVGTPLCPPIALRQHSNFVQGVAFHPGGALIASLGNDRLLRVFSRTLSTLQNEERKWKLAVVAGSSPQGDHRLFVDDVNSKNVVRRLAWSPDGNILACPSGVEAPPGVNRKVFAVHIFSRHELNSPIAQCGGLPCPAVVVRFCPVLFELRKKGVSFQANRGAANATNAKTAIGANTFREPTGSATVVEPGTSRIGLSPLNEPAVSKSSTPAIPAQQNPASLVAPSVARTPSNLLSVHGADASVPCANSPAGQALPPHAPSPMLQSSLGRDAVSSPPVSCIITGLPYRIVFAVGCTDAIYLYDTESFKRPIAHISGLHLAEHTDVSWTPDGRSLLVSSTDGYVSIITFSELELGTPLAGSAVPCVMRPSAAGSSSALQPSSAVPTVVAPRRATTGKDTLGTPSVVSGSAFLDGTRYTLPRHEPDKSFPLTT